jgi:hypothetical protein
MKGLVALLEFQFSENGENNVAALRNLVQDLFG